MRLRSLLGSLLALAALLLATPLQAQSSLERLEQQLRSTETLPAPPPDPAPPADRLAPGYFGAIANDQQPLPGVQILQVVPNGPAEQAGLQEKDLILAINGQPIHNMDDLGQIISASPAGTELSLQISRDGRQTTARVTLGERPGEAGPVGQPVVPGMPAAEQVLRVLLGVQARPLSAEDRQRLQVPAERGAVVTQVIAGSPAEQADIPPEAVIVGVNQLLVTSPEQLAQRLFNIGPDAFAEVTYYHEGRFVRERLQLAPTALNLEQQVQLLERQVQSLQQRVLDLENRLQAPEPQDAP